MPELPEVETIARGLAPMLAGRRLAAVEVLWPGSLAGGRPGLTRAEALACLPGCLILGVRRRAKLLLLDLEPAGHGSSDGPLVLVFHLKMTGGLIVLAPGQAAPDHARLLFVLDDHRRLCFRDMRKFGWARAFAARSLEAWDVWVRLGPEPLDLDAAALAGRFAGRRSRIKALLLDQAVVAGIGNIYADEALFRAGIRPDARADTIARPRLERLAAALGQVLAEALAANGSSIRDYRDALGKAGAFQNEFRVYGRGGEPCRCCGRALVSARVAGRTSTFCPGCQS